MSSSLTSRLGLVKPNPGTGELVNVAAQINASYDKIDAAIGATPCTSTTRPTAPFHGQFIRETDTRQLYVWNATNSIWTPIIIGGSGGQFQDWLDIGRTAVGDFALGVRSSLTSTTHRFVLQANGQMNWGDGANPTDVNLYRSGTTTLRTDDNFSANGFMVNGNASYVMTFSDEVLATALNPVPIAVTDVPGSTIAFTTRKAGAIVKCHYNFDFISKIANAGTAVGRVWIAGTSITDSQAIFNASNTSALARATVGSFKQVTLGAAGNYSAKLQASATIASAFQAEPFHTKLMVEVFE